MQSMALSCGYIGVYGSCRQPLRWQAVQSWQAANQRAKSFHSGFCVRQHKSCPWNGWLIFLHSHGFCMGIPFLCTTQCSWISTQFFLDKDKNILPQEDSVQGSSQWQTRFDFFVSLSYSHFILGQTNFIVGKPPVCLYTFFFPVCGGVQPGKHRPAGVAWQDSPAKAGKFFRRRLYERSRSKNLHRRIGQCQSNLFQISAKTKPLFNL